MSQDYDVQLQCQQVQSHYIFSNKFLLHFVLICIGKKLWIVLFKYRNKMICLCLCCGALFCSYFILAPQIAFVLCLSTLTNEYIYNLSDYTPSMGTWTLGVPVLAGKCTLWPCCLTSIWHHTFHHERYIIPRVANKIIRVKNRVICFPPLEELQRIGTGFEHLAGSATFIWVDTDANSVLAFVCAQAVPTWRMLYSREWWISLHVTTSHPHHTFLQNNLQN